MIDTPVLEAYDRAARGASVPRCRWASSDPAEIAAVVGFLVSDRAFT
ncbi:hypothetical protein HBB16_20115 [Pseudonocardia sp. MCCB 268]|nr:hypothetical protein [Pseudonocardia cytotoxica]